MSKTRFDIFLAGLRSGAKDDAGISFDFGNKEAAAEVLAVIESLIAARTDLRDQFAGQAMQAMLSDRATLDVIRADSARELISPDVLLGTAAYVVADAMLKARRA